MPMHLTHILLFYRNIFVLSTDSGRQPYEAGIDKLMRCQEFTSKIKEVLALIKSVCLLA